jgi:hypothetical protein
MKNNQGLYHKKVNQPVLGREGEAPRTLFVEGATQAPGIDEEQPRFVP